MISTSGSRNFGVAHGYYMQALRLRPTDGPPPSSLHALEAYCPYGPLTHAPRPIPRPFRRPIPRPSTVLSRARPPCGPVRFTLPGNAHNQLAVLASYNDDTMTALFHYYLGSVACVAPPARQPPSCKPDGLTNP